ncbi:MAG: hypothetical protein MUF57_07655 [Gammaproteobacteria bacterium]|nr:hypothetical protein [Gammaproteobacteria bacterium]
MRESPQSGGDEGHEGPGLAEVDAEGRRVGDLQVVAQVGLERLAGRQHEHLDRVIEGRLEEVAAHDVQEALREAGDLADRGLVGLPEVEVEVGGAQPPIEAGIGYRGPKRRGCEEKQQ